MNVLELYWHLDGKMPTSLSCEWDRDGLMCCPSPEKEVKRVLYTLDITDAAIERAIQEKCDVIISHHPLVFHPVKALVPNEATPKKLITLVKNDIAAFSFHTRLDAVEGGVNDVLAQKLGLRDVELFGEGDELIGRIGTIDEECSLSAFAAFVKDVLDTPVVLFNGNRPVKRVAVLGGGGGSFVGAAKAAGADTYVSGRVDYHPIAAAQEDGINLIEAGHFYTENPVLEVLAKFVAAADDKVEAIFVNSCEIQMI